jgi:glycosyltransferase involved in cell wall biosynthesis
VIGVITTSYPRNRDDGAGGFVRERVRMLREQGHVVEILAAGDGEATDDGVTRIETPGLFYTGGAPDLLESTNRRARLRAWGKAVAFSSAMLGELVRRRDRWQAVESHWLVPCGLLVSAAVPGLDHRCHIHGGDLFLLRRLPFADSVARVFCRKRPELVFASARLRDDFCLLAGTAPEALGARTLVEPAPFDRSLFHPRSADDRMRLRRELGLNRPTVLAAGRLVPIKGFDVLIEAVASISNDVRPDVIVAGDGPQLRPLKRQAMDAGVRVHFPGNLGQSALAETMAAADLFVHPCRALSDGRTEGMPLVVREALACGLPVVASASGGLGELDGAQGLRLVAPEHVADLAATIMAALTR